jgi:diaminopimelate epimerase
MSQHPVIEQVGFLVPPKTSAAQVRLEMMGGEFCGNAARSAGWWWGTLHGLHTTTLEVSGFSAPVIVSLSGYGSMLEVPMSFVQGMKSVPEGTLVDLSGIRHLIVQGKRVSNPRKLIERYCDGCAAVGVMFTQTHRDGITIDPLVWVRDTDTFVEETACGSGSIAASVAHNSGKSVCGLKIEQPSGETFLACTPALGATADTIRLQGSVEYKGEGDLQCPAPAHHWSQGRSVLSTEIMPAQVCL